MILNPNQALASSSLITNKDSQLLDISVGRHQGQIMA
jgi:hypothetical protein